MSDLFPPQPSLFPQVDPRDAIMASIFDQNITHRGSLVPLGRTATGETTFATPQFLVDMVRRFMLPGAALKGYMAQPNEVTDMALDVAGGGLAVGKAPAGSVGMFAGRTAKDPKMVDVLNARHAEMQLPPKSRVQPRSEGLATPAIDDSIAAHMRHESIGTAPEYPRLPEGDSRAYPKGDRVRPLIDRKEELGQAYAESMRGELTQMPRFFYHTDPIYRAAIDAGLTPKDARAWIDEFGGAYAATSPRTSTEQNLRNATLAMAKRDAGIPLSDVIGPGTGGLNESGYPMMIGDSGIHRMLLDDVYGGGINPNTNPKPWNFQRNLAGNLNGVTVDTHVIRGVLATLNDIQPGAIPVDFIKPQFREMYLADPKQLNAATWIDDTLASAQVNGQSMQVEYGPFADVVHSAGETLGVFPAEAQSMGWFGMGGRTGLASERKTVANLLNERIDTTAQLLGISPQDAARLIFQKKIPLASLAGGTVAYGLMGGGQEARAAPPWTTEDVPLDQQIIRFLTETAPRLNMRDTI